MMINLSHVVFARFDYEGMAESGGDLSQATLSRWKEDILAVLDKVPSGPQVTQLYTNVFNPLILTTAKTA